MERSQLYKMGHGQHSNLTNGYEVNKIISNKFCNAKPGTATVKTDRHPGLLYGKALTHNYIQAAIFSQN